MGFIEPNRTEPNFIIRKPVISLFILHCTQIMRLNIDEPFVTANVPHDYLPFDYVFCVCVIQALFISTKLLLTSK